VLPNKKRQKDGKDLLMKKV